jgi:hypothetical protein
MNPFKPKSPNPSIRTSGDAAPAVLGQLNQVVAQKADTENYKTEIYNVYPFPILPSMVKLGDNYSQASEPGNQDVTFDTYRINGSINIDSGQNYANWYLGTIEWKSGCVDVYHKVSGGIRAYDYDNDNGSYEITPFGPGGLMADNNGYFYPLTQADIYCEYFTYTNNGQQYNGVDFFLHLYAADATVIEGDISFQIDTIFNDFCNKNNEITFYFD